MRYMEPELKATVHLTRGSWLRYIHWETRMKASRSWEDMDVYKLAALGQPLSLHLCQHATI